ncbi:MAG: class I SAM-dependent methyltransferase [Pseudomarimonas sp.]
MITRKTTHQHLSELIDPATQTYGDWPVWKHTIAFPSSVMMGTSGTHLLETYLVVGTAWQQVISYYLPDASGAGADILDIGCGCAKIARHLVADPRVRSYRGFDPMQACVEWCQRFVAPLGGERFCFEHIDLYSSEYNPQGRVHADQFVFPLTDQSIDIAIAASIFTHLLEPDARNYLRQSARVLRPGGRLILSLHTEPANGLVYTGDEARIDIQLDHFLDMVTESGLTVEEDLGSLCGQHALVLSKGQ